MKFLVLGCNGMAGHMISLYLKEQGHSVFGFDRSAPRYVNGIAGDAKGIRNVLYRHSIGQFPALLVV